MKKKCNCGGLQAYAEGGRTRVPTRSTRFIDPEAERFRGLGVLEALRGYAGAPSQASVMYPGAAEAYETGELAGLAEAAIPGAAMAKGALGAALAGVIKPRGGNWLESGLKPVLQDLKRAAYNRPEPLENEYPVELFRQNEALNRWIEGPLTKYIKRDIGTEQDPVRRLFDEGVYHVPPESLMDYRDMADADLALKRQMLDQPREPLSSGEGRYWENLVDEMIVGGPASEYTTPVSPAWMQKDPTATVYHFGPPAWIRPFPENALGLSHITDELDNSLMGEAGGLPRKFWLTPEKIEQMGMEKAVRHVDAINKWRAAQQAAANAELANRAMVLREYPDVPEMPNPKGLRWMELGPEKDINESLIQVGRDGGAKVGVPGEEAKYFDSPEEAKKYLTSRNLEKQLKYEGDTMGHCVGGYCEDVLEGRSRIFSLRDVKGEPHVTVEVGPGLKPDFESLVDRAYRSGDHSRFEREFDRINGLGAYELLDREMREVGMGEDLWDFTHYALQRHPETMVRWAQPSIKQVKGKQNLAPKDEYLPFVQDFVRNSPLGTPWGQVEDLKNTGLRQVGDKYVTLDELKDVPRDGLGSPIGYQPLDDRPAWKDGGLVTQPDYFDDLGAFLGR